MNIYMNKSLPVKSCPSSSLVEPQADHEQFEDEETLKQFLDSLWQEVEADRSKLVPYTQEMYDEAMRFTAGVSLD